MVALKVVVVQAGHVRGQPSQPSSASINVTGSIWKKTLTQRGRTWTKISMYIYTLWLYNIAMENHHF